MTCRRVKQVEICNSGELLEHIWVTFDLKGFKVISLVIRYSSLKMNWNSKKAGCRVKVLNIWTMSTSSTRIWFAVDILVLKIIWRLFAVLLFTGTVTQSTTSYRAKRTDIFDLRGTNGTYFVYIWPCSARYDLRVIKCTCFKVDCISSCRTLCIHWMFTTEAEISLCFTLLPAVFKIQVCKNRKCTEWPQNDRKHLSVKNTLYTLNTHPEAQISIRFAVTQISIRFAVT